MPVLLVTSVFTHVMQRINVERGVSMILIAQRSQPTVRFCLLYIQFWSRVRIPDLLISLLTLQDLNRQISGEVTANYRVFDFQSLIQFGSWSFIKQWKLRIVLKIRTWSASLMIEFSHFHRFKLICTMRIVTCKCDPICVHYQVIINLIDLEVFDQFNGPNHD